MTNLHFQKLDNLKELQRRVKQLNIFREPMREVYIKTFLYDVDRLEKYFKEINREEKEEYKRVKKTLKNLYREGLKECKQQ